MRSKTTSMLLVFQFISNKDCNLNLNFIRIMSKHKFQVILLLESLALILLDAYLNPTQTQVIPTTFEIEHIFPKKWQNTNYHGWDEKDAQTFLDRFGNKIAFEKKLNIQAGNGYFGVKKKRYAVSGISVVQDLSNYPKNDSVKEDIIDREKEFVTRLVDFFEKAL